MLIPNTGTDGACVKPQLHHRDGAQVVRNGLWSRTTVALENTLDKAGTGFEHEVVADDKPILVLGLGNDILRDDAVGLMVARELQSRFADHPLVEVAAACEMGLGLLDYIMGHRALLVVDAVETGKTPPGHVYEVGEADLPSLPGMSPHFLGVGEILTLGRRMDYVMPETVTILAIEVADARTLGEQLTPAVAAALPGIVARAEDWVRRQAARPWSD